MSFESWKKKLFPDADVDGLDDELVESRDYDMNENAEDRPASFASAAPRPAQIAPRTGSAMEMKVVSPTKFETAPSIADLLCDGVTVLLNLEQTNKEVSRRLIDFLSGVAYSLGGAVKRVAENTFAITPKNVNVSNDALESAPQEAAAPSGEAY